MIKVNGLNEEIEKLSLLNKVYTQEILKEANSIGLDFRDDVRANTPEGRTGDLRRSTNFDGAELKNKDITIKVYNNIEYAEHVEYGHRQEVGRYVPAIKKRLKKPFVQGVHMLRDAENNILNELDARVKEAVRRADEKLSD